MVKLTRIYTRGGDKGETSLVDGSRTPKHALRVAAMGTVDEVNACLGIVRLHTQGEADAMLARIQDDLFDLGADIGMPGDEQDNASLRILQQPVRVERGKTIGGRGHLRRVGALRMGEGEHLRRIHLRGGRALRGGLAGLGGLAGHEASLRKDRLFSQNW